MNIDGLSSSIFSSIIFPLSPFNYLRTSSILCLTYSKSRK